jgi:hypothetical protein
MRRSRSGNSFLETILYLPPIFLLLFGVIELARVAFTYHTLHKTLSSVARFAGTQQGVNYCGESDVDLVGQAKRYGLSGSTDESAPLVIPDLAVDMIDVRFEQVATDNTLAEFVAEGGCGRAPDFVVVTIPNGYPVQLRIPFMTLEPVPLRPVVRLAFRGT